MVICVVIFVTMFSSTPLKPFHHLRQVASKVTRERGKREKGQRVGGFYDPSLEEAHIPSAHLSLAGITHMPPPNCKGGWEMWSS